MVKLHTCETCGKDFKQKGHLDQHKNRKTPCVPDKHKEEVSMLHDVINIYKKENEQVQERIDKIKSKFVDYVALHHRSEIEEYKDVKREIDNL